MKRIRMLVGLIVLLGSLFFGLTPSYAGDGFQEKVAFLTGNAEVNSAGEPGKGDPDGVGTARLAFSARQQQVCVNIQVSNIEPIVMAHIHNAPAGSNGGVVLNFGSLIDGNRVRGCVAASPTLVRAILADPASYYVNVHSATFPAGAVRGQLEQEGSLFKSFSVAMRGSNEVGTPGDPDGSGTAHVQLRALTSEICINLRARAVAPLTLAHIHNAPAGSNGGVVVDFGSLIDGTRVRGCVPVEPNLFQTIRTSPQNFYVNVHNAEFPAGALRGQLQ